MEKEEFADIHEFLKQFETEFEYIEMSDEIAEISYACEMISNEIKI